MDGLGKGRSHVGCALVRARLEFAVGMGLKPVEGSKCLLKLPKQEEASLTIFFRRRSLSADLKDKLPRSWDCDPYLDPHQAHFLPVFIICMRNECACMLALILTQRRQLTRRSLEDHPSHLQSGRQLLLAAGSHATKWPFAAAS